MIKRFLIGLTIGAVMFVGALIGTEAFATNKYEVFTYEITDVNGDEINGVALDHKSFDNSGIYLLQSQTAPILKVGDVIKVAYEKGVYDNILDIERVE